MSKTIAELEYENERLRYLLKELFSIYQESKHKGRLLEKAMDTLAMTVGCTMDPISAADCRHTLIEIRKELEKVK